LAQKQRYFYANKDRDGFPVPGTMMSFDRPLNLNKVTNKIEIKNSYPVLPCQTVLRNKRGLRYFVEVDDYGDIIPNRLFTALYPPRNIKYVEILNIVGTPCVTLSMKNFLSTDTPGYPVGVWNTAGTYLGTADNQSDYITLWNSDVTNQAQGTLLPGSTSTEFYIADTPNVTISFVRGLRYYRLTGPANPSITIGFNDIVKYGSTTKTGALDSVPTNSDTRMEWNRLLLNANNTKIPQTTVYVLSCAGNPDSTPVFIFHNEDGEYVGGSYPNPNGGIYTISGALPKAVKAVSFRTSQSVNYNLINNWQELTSLWSFYPLAAGGGIWNFSEPSNWPSTINASQITQTYVGQAYNQLTYVASFMTYANYPNLMELMYSTNLSVTTYVGQEGWFLTAPRVKDYLFVSVNTIATTSVADTIWNNVYTNFVGVIPTTGRKQLCIRITTAVSAASLVSRTNLAAQGWIVTLS
jgi:hypothetical protein